MKKYKTFLCLLLIISCAKSDEKTSIFIEFNEIDRLTKMAPIYYKNVKVGTVESIRVLNGHILVGGEIDKSISIPINSKFNLIYTDRFGSRGIEIVPSLSKTQVQSGDTVKGLLTKELREVDMDSLDARLVIDSVFKEKK